MLFRFPPDARWNPERPVVEFGIGVGALPAGADTRAQRALFHYRQNGTRTGEGAAPDLGGTSPALLPRQGLALGAKPGQSYAPRVNKMSVALTIALALASLPTRLGGRIVDAVSNHSGCC